MENTVKFYVQSNISNMKLRLWNDNYIFSKNSLTSEKN